MANLDAAHVLASALCLVDCSPRLLLARSDFEKVAMTAFIWVIQTDLIEGCPEFHE